MLSAAAAAAAALSASAPAGAAPQQKPADVKSQVDGLYEQAEAATEKYDAARESETRLRGRLETLRGELARGQQAVNTLRDRLGAIATAQYREGGIDPALTLLLSADPNSYLDRAAALDRIEGRHADRLRQLHDARQAVERERRQATTELTRLESTRHQMAAHKRTVQRKLGRARALLDSLAPPSRPRSASDRPAPAPGWPGCSPAAGPPRALRPGRAGRRRGPLGPRLALRVGQHRTVLLRLLGPDAVVLPARRDHVAAHLAGTAARRPAGRARPGPPR